MNYTPYFEAARKAGRSLNLPADIINNILADLASETIAQTKYLLSENKKDLKKLNPEHPNYDRLKLTEERIKDIAKAIQVIADLDSPLGMLLSEKTMPNGLHISKVSVPLGVVGVIYEARPNVTFDVFALCFKTGNVCVLKGGSDAAFSNQAIIAVIHNVLAKHGIDTSVAILLPNEREAAEALMQATGYVDVIIPRGSQGLIDSVRKTSKVPVIETGAGIVHTYFDEFGDLKTGSEVILNAKTRRVSVCNALDCAIVHSSRLSDLSWLMQTLGEAGITVFADDRAYNALEGHYPSQLLFKADESHFGTEFLSMKMALKTVDSLKQALDHINTYGSKHSEAIITGDATNAEIFLNTVDAAAVYVNASTAFTDGGEFGLAAEIGISTQKLHARGPMGLKELTSYKWIVRGNGQVRR